MSTIRICLLILSMVSLSATNALANPSVLGDWLTFYGFSSSNPVQDSLTDAGSTECQTCHLDTNGGQPWNAYGWELHLNGVDFGAADFVDSDGDGFTNGEEIGFLDPDGYGAQPGWTDDVDADLGNVACVDQGPNFGCSPVLFENVPDTAGPLDAPEPGLTLQVATGAAVVAWMRRRRSKEHSIGAP